MRLPATCVLDSVAARDVTTGWFDEHADPSNATATPDMQHRIYLRG